MSISTKWPAMIVVGEKVTKDQAKEILIRTDRHRLDFSYAGNDHNYRKQLEACLPKSPEQDFKESLCKSYGVLELEYLSNDRIVSSWIGGPHGWCDWNGNIFCNNYNVGKWPNDEELLNEWSIIAEAFPFLNLNAWYMSGETSEENTIPVLQIKVQEGKAIIVEDIENPKVPVVPVGMDNLFSILSGNTGRERGCSLETLKEALDYTEKVIKTKGENDETGNN